MAKRIRHHINPFKSHDRIRQEDWIGKYKQFSGPVHMDIGCAKGVFVSELAKKLPEIFFIGIELRPEMGKKYFPAYEEIPNLALLCGNINLSLSSMFPEPLVDVAYINFPDPYTFKNRDRKKRMVNADFVKDLAGVLKPEGNVFVQTDQMDLFTDMHNLFLKEFSCLTDAVHPEEVENQTGAQSAWEIQCEKHGKDICRAVYTPR